MINFLIVSAAIFMVVKLANSLQRPQETEDETDSEPDAQERLINVLERLETRLQNQ
ncbi:MAG: hypothetical protein AAFQ07_15390 [Chloroflexota bacterium]